MAKIEDLMRNCLKAMEEGKSVEAVDFFTDDGVWITPFGKFVGQEQIKKFLNCKIAKCRGLLKVREMILSYLTKKLSLST